jgi:hypothetical protein
MSLLHKLLLLQLSHSYYHINPNHIMNHNMIGIFFPETIIKNTTDIIHVYTVEDNLQQPRHKGTN